MAKTENDPESPFFYLQTHKATPDLQKVIVTPENLSYYKELAASNLKEGHPDMALNLYRECINNFFKKKL